MMDRNNILIVITNGKVSKICTNLRRHLSLSIVGDYLAAVTFEEKPPFNNDPYYIWLVLGRPNNVFIQEYEGEKLKTYEDGVKYMGWDTSHHKIMHMDGTLTIKEIGNKDN